MNLARRIRSLARRAFEAAGPAQPLGRWPVASMMQSPARAALAALPTMRARVRYLVANTALGASLANVWTTQLVADGPSITSAHSVETVARLQAERGEAWLYGPNVDIEGGDIVSVLTRTVHALVQDGEAFWRFIVTERGVLRVQMIAPEQIDSTARDLADGSRIEAGIELGPNGERRAYYIRRDDRLRSEPVRVPASEVCHIFELRYPGQLRGIPWLASVATRIVELDGVEDAAAVKARVTALFCGFVTDVDGSGGGLADGATFDPATLSMEPGTVRMLPPGTDIEFPPTADLSGLGDLLRHMTRSVAVGAGLPYELTSGDLSQTSYASARVGLHHFQRRVQQLRMSVLVNRFLAPLYRRFVLLEILSGRLDAPGFERDPETWFAADFLWAGWPAINPLDEAKADAIAIESGTRSRAEVIAARGRSIQDVDAERDADTFKPSPNRPALRLVEPENAA